MRKRLELSDRDQKIVDFANELMDIPVGWIGDPPELDPESIRLFQRTLQAFLDEIGSRTDLIDAAVAITALIRLKGYKVPRLPLPSLERYMTVEDFHAIQQDVAEKLLKEDGSAIDETKLIAYLDNFWEEEKEILWAAGLNQLSIQIIEARLKARQNQIIRNCIAGLVVSRSKWERAISAARSLSDYRITGKTRTEYNRFTVIARLKGRVVGLSIIFADLVPLFYRASVGTAGFISTIAGTTAATILPSSSK